MKLVIEHSKTKRQIEGAFELCASREDLTELVRQITNRLNEDGWSYGWMTVYPKPISQPNTPPKHWDA